LSESFELKIPETVNVPKESIIRVIAKTKRDTLHPDDPQYKHRVFEENELMMASRSLALKPVGLNHLETIPDAIVVNADWNVKDKVVEALLSLPKKFIDLIRKKEITKVSVDYNWDAVEKQGEKSVFKGLKFLGLSLLHGLNPGDPGANILFESQTGRETMEIQVKGEPFAGYKDFADCVAKNKDKDDPEAYCGSIKAKVETVSLAEAAQIEKLTKTVEEKDKRIEELETAVSTATQATETLKTSHDKDVSDAEEKGRTDVKREVIGKLEEIIVPPHVECRWGQVSAVLLNTDVKRLKRRLEADGESR